MKILDFFNFVLIEFSYFAKSYSAIMKNQTKHSF